MGTAILENEDLKDIKIFPVLKDLLNQFEFCLFKVRKMNGGFELVDSKKIVWSTDYSKFLKFENYFRTCCNIKVVDNMVVIGEYALRLKQN